MSKRGIFATIPIAELSKDRESAGLVKTLGPGALIAIGIGGIIGTGIFVLTGLAAARRRSDYRRGNTDFSGVRAHARRVVDDDS